MTSTPLTETARSARRAPGRWYDAPEWSERLAAPLLRLAGRDPRMEGEELAALIDALNQRDEPGDALVRAIREERTVTMAQVRTALEHGLAALEDPPAALTDFFGPLEQRPDWVDDELLARGARAARRVGQDGFDVLAFGSLLGGYRSGAALQPLMRTGRIGEKTLQRVGETGEWFLAATSPGGLERGGAGWRLSVHVRVMHAFVNYQLEHEPDWDWDYRGVPINQHDRAATLGSFSTSFLLQARTLGIRITPEDSAAVMHLWSYVGWLMGVEERWLPRTERVGRRILGNILTGLSAPDEASRILGAGLIDMHDQAPGISRLRRRYERERALSMATFLQLGYGMKDVGQPVRPPWYPMIRIASNLFFSQLVGRLPGGEAVLDRRAERALRRLEDLQYGGRRPPIPQVGAA